MPHVRNALARLNQAKDKDGNPISQSKQDEIRTKLQEILKRSRENMEYEISVEDLDIIKVYEDYQDDLPSYLDVTGMLFRPGKHKGKPFSAEQLSKARMMPRDGETLVYTNLFHIKKEPFRNGLLRKIWWDPNKEWTDKTTGVKGKGALMFNSTVTDPQTIKLLIDKKIKNVSAELSFDYFGPTADTVEDIGVHGMAFTDMPAVKEAGAELVIGDNGFKARYDP